MSNIFSMDYYRYKYARESDPHYQNQLNKPKGRGRLEEIPIIFLKQPDYYADNGLYVDHHRGRVSGRAPNPHESPADKITRIRESLRQINELLEKLRKGEYT